MTELDNIITFLLPNCYKVTKYERYYQVDYISNLYNQNNFFLSNSDSSLKIFFDSFKRTIEKAFPHLNIDMMFHVDDYSALSIHYEDRKNDL